MLLVTFSLPFLGARQSILVDGAGQRPMVVTSGRYCAVRLLHFAAAILHMSLALHIVNGIVGPEMSDTGLMCQA